MLPGSSLRCSCSAHHGDAAGADQLADPIRHEQVLHLLTAGFRPRLSIRDFPARPVSTAGVRGGVSGGDLNQDAFAPKKQCSLECVCLTCPAQAMDTGFLKVDVCVAKADGLHRDIPPPPPKNGDFLRSPVNPDLTGFTVQVRTAKLYGRISGHFVE